MTKKDKTAVERKKSEAKEEAVASHPRDRKKSSKKNKYKHLDEMRKAHQQTSEDVEKKLAKVDLDIGVKLGKVDVAPTKIGECDSHEKVKKHLPKARKRKNADTMDTGTAVKKKKKRIVEDTPDNETIDSKRSHKKQKRKKDLRPKESYSTENLERLSNKVVENSRQKTKNVFGDVSQLKTALAKDRDVDETVSQGKKKNRRNQSLRDKMMEKLNAARFRYLNEQLYTVPGNEVCCKTSGLISFFFFEQHSSNNVSCV